MGLPRITQRVGVIQKLKTSKSHRKNGAKNSKKSFSLGSSLQYVYSSDSVISQRIVAACGSIVTPVEGELTNEMLFQHATTWASGLQGLFGCKDFTALGKAPKKKNKEDATNTKKSKQLQGLKKKGKEVVRVRSKAPPYLAGHVVRKQALWLIEAHKDRGTCRVDWSQMTVRDLGKLMPDSTDNLEKVGFSHKATVFDVVEGMDPLRTATFLCLLRPVEKDKTHLKAITNSANHELGFRLIEEHKSKFGVPPPPSWLAKQLAEGGRVGGHRPRDDQSSTGHTQNAALGADSAPGETQKAAVQEHRPQDHESSPVDGGAEVDPSAWYSTEPAPTKRLQCQCKGNCRGMCPGRHGRCPNVAVANMPGGE